MFESRNQEFARKVYEKLCDKFCNIMSLIYLDNHNTNIKQLARVPTSIHEKSGEVCIVVNEKLEQTKIRSPEYYRLYGILSNEVGRIIEIVKAEEEIKKEKKAHEEAQMPRSVGWSHVRQGNIRPCFQKALDVGEAEHKQRRALLLEAFCSGITTEEEMTKLFSRFHDYDGDKENSVCRYQIHWFFERVVQPLLNRHEIVKPYKCETIYNCGWCLKNECPLYKGGDNKPVGQKPFDKQSYEQNKWVEDFLISKLRIEGYSISKNTDKHGIDLLIWKEGKIVGGIEAEWHGRHWIDKFPFTTIHCLGRKFKYADQNCFYVMVNSSGANALILSFDEVIKGKLISVNTAYCDKEVFFDVPVEKAVWGWEKINQYLNEYFHRTLK